MSEVIALERQPGFWRLLLDLVEMSGLLCVYSTVSRMVSAGHLRSARGHLMNSKVFIKAFQLGTLSSFHEAFWPGIVIDSVGFAAALELTYRTLHACKEAEIQIVRQQFDWFTLGIPKQISD